MSAPKEILDRVIPRQQQHWDIRGALNFVFGGAGGGLLVATALAASQLSDVRPFVFAGMALVGLGLFCVWLKIGRPWRALFVFRRPSTSWMTREAMISIPLFACGAYALLTQSIAAVWAAGLLGLVFAYAQGRILKANIGIPAWRNWECVALIVVTALTEGTGLLLLGGLFWPTPAGFAWLLAALLVVRLVAWRAYRAVLRKTGVPKGTNAEFDDLAPTFLWLGHAAPFVLACLTAANFGALPGAVAGLLALLSGAFFKYSLVCRAAFTQGFALPRTPSRGFSKPGAGVKPGWEPAQRA